MNAVVISQAKAVSEVTRAVRGAIRQDPRLVDLWVEGEIGRVTISSAGHVSVDKPGQFPQVSTPTPGEPLRGEAGSNRDDAPGIGADTLGSLVSRDPLTVPR